MYTINYQKKFYLAIVDSFDENTNSFIVTKPIQVFQSQQELVYFLASKVKIYHYKDSTRWTCEYFELQNLTGTDTHRIYSWWNNKQESYQILNPYYFFDENNNTVDVRNFKEDVFALIYADLSNLLPVQTYQHKKYNRRKKHTMTKFRHARIYRTARFASIKEYSEYIPSDEKHLKNCYYDDFYSRKSCGWKDQTKCRHQWEKHLK